MATSSNRVPMTQAPVRRSFKSDQNDDANAPNCVIVDPHIEGEGEGESGYKVRSEDELSKVEQLCLDTVDDNPMAQNFFTLDLANLFKGPKNQLEAWPHFFRSKEESGIELQQGLVLLWSNFLIAETLMATISIQPLVMVPNVAHGWQLKLYGYTWMISIISDLWGIANTALFLGFLFACPNKVAWKWMCAIGWLRNIPVILVLLDTMLTFVAIACSCWILYGYQMGIVCAMVEVFSIATGLKLACMLDEAKEKVTNKNM